MSYTYDEGVSYIEQGRYSIESAEKLTPVSGLIEGKGSTVLFRDREFTSQSSLAVGEIERAIIRPRIVRRCSCSLGNLALTNQTLSVEPLTFHPRQCQRRLHPPNCLEQEVPCCGR